MTRKRTMSIYLPSIKDAEKVKSCVRAGISDIERVARIVGITKKQLEDNYQYELGYTDDEELAVIADVAYEMASSGKFPHMTMWWLRCKGGHQWQEKRQIELENSSPLVVIIKGENPIDGSEAIPITNSILPNLLEG